MADILFSREEPDVHFWLRALVYKSIKNLDQWFRRSFFKGIYVFSADGLFVGQSQTVCAILVQGNIKNISVKLF